MDDDAITVRCVCGWETVAPEHKVVVAATEHGRKLHIMTPTREEVMQMAVRPSESTRAGRTPDA